MMRRGGVLDERLDWPGPDLRRHGGGGAWRLGQGLTVVGPGWWPLVRAAVAAVAETPGAAVADVRQRCATLAIRMRHLDGGVQSHLDALAAELVAASRSTCEACGAKVPPARSGEARWRNHCPTCRARYAELAADGAGGAERRLWEQHSGRAWPWSEWW